MSHHTHSDVSKRVPDAVVAVEILGIEGNKTKVKWTGTLIVSACSTREEFERDGGLNEKLARPKVIGVVLIHILSGQEAALEFVAGTDLQREWDAYLDTSDGEALKEYAMAMVEKISKTP